MSERIAVEMPGTCGDIPASTWEFDPEKDMGFALAILRYAREDLEARISAAKSHTNAA